SFRNITAALFRFPIFWLKPGNEKLRISTSENSSISFTTIYQDPSEYIHESSYGPDWSRRRHLHHSGSIDGAERHAVSEGSDRLRRPLRTQLSHSGPYPPGMDFADDRAKSRKSRNL